jgi:ribose transport system substrate-binding protein
MPLPTGRSPGMPRRTLVALLLVAVSVGATLAGTSSARPLASKRVVLVTCEPNVFCHAYNVNLVKKLKAAGVSVTQLSDNFDPALQNQHMNQAIAQKPDAILVFASNADAIVPALKRARAAGITTVNLNARLKPSGEKYTSFEVVADNHALGRFAAMNLVEGMKKAGYTKGRVILVTGTMGTLIVQDRLDEFYKYFKKYPQYQIAPAQDGNWDQVKSSQLALQLFTKYRSQGGVQGAYGMADYMAAGIIQAANQLGVPVGLAKKGAIVTGSNCTPAGWPLLQSGSLYGDATQSPIQESDTTAQHVIAFLNGTKQPHTTTVKELRFTQSTYKPFLRLCGKWPS